MLKKFFIKPSSFLQKVSIWSNVPMGVSEAFNADKDPRKLNLGVGAYRDDNGKPVVLPSVLEASKRIVDLKLNNEYLPIAGDASYLKNCQKLALGNPLPTNTNLATIQTLSGTGALRLAGAFLQRFGGSPTVYVPAPTWSNHFSVFQDCGLNVETYRYYDDKKIALDKTGLLDDIFKKKKGVFLLHASAHNPTGVDPTQDEWKEISTAMLKAGHLVLFDMAYQGFASGDPVRDAFAVRYFISQGHNMMLAQSFAKNFGLYGHRVGALTLTVDKKDTCERVESQLKILARAMYSNPPMHGSRIVDIILSDETLSKQWHGEVKGMAERIISMRTALTNALKKAGSTRNWSHINSQIGMFCYSGMTPEQVDRLQSEFRIYLTRNGRISMAGVTSKNVEYLANAMHAVTK